MFTSFAIARKTKKTFPTLMFSPLPFNHKKGSAGVGSTLFAWFVDTPKRRTLCEVRFPGFLEHNTSEL